MEPVIRRYPAWHEPARGHFMPRKSTMLEQREPGRFDNRTVSPLRHFSQLSNYCLQSVSRHFSRNKDIEFNASKLRSFFLAFYIESLITTQ